MDYAELIQTYGYLAVSIGTMLEGEAVLILAAFAASLGHLKLSLVITIAAFSSCLGDQIFFHAGRRYGPALLARFPSIRPRAIRATELLHRHHLLLILSIRFLYGLRMAGLIAIGMSGVHPARFLALSFISAVTWAVLIGSAGYLFGRTLERLLAEYGYYSTLIVMALILCGALVFLLLRRRRAAIAADK